MTHASGRALAPVLVFTTMVSAVVSSLGAPLIPTISRNLHVPLSTAQWSLTVALLVGAVSAPVMGRLGDGPRRRGTLIVGLAAVTAGGAIAALSSGLVMLLVGRGLQGVGLGLVPLTMAAARAHLPTERVRGTIALLSVCAAGAAGAGYPLSGFIADAAGLPAAFWFGASVTGLALVCVVLVVPPSADAAGPPLDVLGAALLTAALVALLLAIAQGDEWGWTSHAVLLLLALSAAGLVVWIRQQLQSAAPLVELRLLRHPAVLTGDACALVLAVAMYMNLTAVTAYVQTPAAVGYGFSASVVVAGLCLVPFAVLSLAASRLLPWLSEVLGARAVLPVGSLAVAAAAAFFAVFHTHLWQAFVMMAVVGVGIGLTFAAIPGIIVGAVPHSETGSAMGFYQVVRYIGFSLGSALAAAILAVSTRPGQHLPTEAGYTRVLSGAAVICVVAAALAWRLSGREAGAGRGAERFGEEDAQVATAGLVGLSHD
jgi:MFS family permease